LAARRKLAKSVRSEEQQIKELVANNFDKFIQSKNAIDAVVAQIELHHDADADLARLYATLLAAASALYRPILSKLAESNRLQALLSLTERFQFLFSLPERVRAADASLHDKELVLRDFEKARRLVHSTKIALFYKIFDEIQAQMPPFTRALYADLAALDLNRDAPLVDRAIRLIDDIYRATHDGAEMPAADSPAAHYFRQRCALLVEHLRHASLDELRAFVLTNEIEFLERSFDVDELLRPGSELVRALHTVLDEFAARAGDSVSPLVAFSSLISALRSRKLPTSGGNVGTADDERGVDPIDENDDDHANIDSDGYSDSDSSGESLSKEDDEKEQQQQQQPQQQWYGNAARIVEEIEVYLVERARTVLTRHVERAFDGVRAHIVDSVWQAASPVQLAARSEALAVTRSQRQARFEQSLRQAPIGGDGDVVQTSQFFATASGVDARQLRERLLAARRVLVTRCFRPLREALPWLAEDDIELMHERLVDTLRLVVALLSADASFDSSGLATLAVLATLHYVRHEFAPDLFASFRTQFAVVAERAALPRALGDAIRALEQSLSRAFVRLHLAPIDSIVTDGMLRSGTNWFFHEARGMRVNDYVVKLLLRLVSTHNQLATRCPNLLDTILTRLFDGTISSIIATLPSIECFDAAGLLQLEIDVAFIRQSLARYVTPGSRGLADALDRRIALAARAVNAEQFLASEAAVQSKAQALARTQASTQVLFLCFK
jgi:hypothetical protein